MFKNKDFFLLMCFIISCQGCSTLKYIKEHPFKSLGYVSGAALVGAAAVANAYSQSNQSDSSSVYYVEVSYNDELFIINGEKYEAKTYCFNVNEDDRVIFLEGSPLVVCVSAVFKDLDTGTVRRCWCE